MFEDYEEEDPQVKLRQPSKLFVGKPLRSETTQQPPAPVLSAGLLTDDTGRAVSIPKVQDLTETGTNPKSVTVSQEYVNKVVQSLGAVRSAVVSRRPPPVLNERALR